MPSAPWPMDRSSSSGGAATGTVTVISQPSSVAWWMRPTTALLTVQVQVWNSFFTAAVQPVVDRVVAARTSATKLFPGSTKDGTCPRGTQMSGWAANAGPAVTSDIHAMSTSMVRLRREIMVLSLFVGS